MENLSHPLVITFFASWILEVYLFGMQRASLIISRQCNVKWRGIGEQLLPNWYPVTWIVKMAKYGLLVAILILISWKLATGLLIGSSVVMAIIPIPYKLLYKKKFRNKVEKLKSTDEELGQFFADILNNANF